MVIRINHPDISGNEKTYLTAASTVGATELTVQNVSGFSVNNYVVFGKLGSEYTEISKISAISTSLTVSALSFAHSINTPITKIPFNQAAVYKCPTKTGTYAIVGSLANLQADKLYTEIEDVGGLASNYYKTRFYNVASTVWSSYSDIVQGTGYTQDSLGKIIEKANALTGDRNNRVLSQDEKIDIINDGYQQAINKLEKADSKRFVKKAYVDIKNSYNTGTVAVTDGSTTVAGTGTTWSTGWTGKKIIFSDEGFPYEIASVGAVGTLTLTRGYNGAGSNLSGSTYIIFQDEYDIYDETTGEEITDFKKIEQVVDEDGNIVNEFDLHRNEDGYYLKRDKDNLKLCLNYQPDTTKAEGRWTVQYSYQPPLLDSLGDEPEFPQGYSVLLVHYLKCKIRERQGDTNGAGSAMGEFTDGLNKMIGQATPRTNEKKGFRLENNNSKEDYDSDWGETRTDV